MAALTYEKQMDGLADSRNCWIKGEEKEERNDQRGTKRVRTGENTQVRKMGPTDQGGYGNLSEEQERGKEQENIRDVKREGFLVFNRRFVVCHIPTKSK